MFTEHKIDDFEIFRSSYYKPWKSPTGVELQLNEQPYLDVVVTDHCNRKCGFCIADLIEKKRDCDPETFKNQIDYAIKNLGVQEVLVVGGEPTIAKNLFEILGYLAELHNKGRLKKICLTSNGDKLHKDGKATKFARELFKNITHLNLSLMSTCAESQRDIAGKRGKPIDVLIDLPAIHEAAQTVSVRVNANIFRSNLDTLGKIENFYDAVRPCCDSVKFSPLLRVDNFSVVEKTTEWVRQNILSPEEYEALYKSVETHFAEYPIVRNSRTFGFVEYSMLCLPTPIVLNYNHRNEMAKRASAGFVNNIKLLTNGNLSLSWNRDDESKVIRSSAIPRSTTKILPTSSRRF